MLSTLIYTTDTTIALIYKFDLMVVLIFYSDSKLTFLWVFSIVCSAEGYDAGSY